jgi:hypothetical protein
MYCLTTEQPPTTLSQKTESIVAARHSDEPVSGVQGRGTVTDPYDAGNRDGKPSIYQNHLRHHKNDKN